MGMKEGVPFVAMVVVQIAEVGLLVVGKKVILDGMTNFIFICYSNALSAIILLPSSFLIHRSAPPPLNFSLIAGFLFLGLLGFLIQIFGYAGVLYVPASFASSMLNLIPGFTFILAIIFRMEKIDCKRSSTLAKSMGTTISILGALIVTLYKGPNILITQSSHSSWLLGALLLLLDSLLASIFIISQAFVLRKYLVDTIIMFVYCCVVSVLSGLVALLLERQPSSWSLRSNTRLFALTYSGFFGSAFQVTVGAWCLRRKGPLFVAMFRPLGIVISIVMGVFFLGDAFFLGSLVGSIVIIIGFYGVMWGKSNESKMVEEVDPFRTLESTTTNTALLHNNSSEDQI